jgi:hypothetical protein
MDYTWLDKLPRIEKGKIPEPVKYWALYAKSFYENFLGLIDNPRRLRKATVRKLEQLDDPEAKDALLFFFRIRRDELDGIQLWESLKSKYTKLLNESPDMIEADNLSKVRPGKNTLGLTEFQFPFGYFDGKMRVGKLMGIHPDIYNFYQDMQGFTGRMSMDYAGRVWISDKIISFWDYPPTKEKLLEIIKDIEEEFREKFKKPLYINPKDWYIEIIDKKLPRKPLHSFQFKDWDDAENATLIKVDDYKGSGEWSEEKRIGPHIAVPRGDFGSRHPKYQGRQKEKRYMYAESYVFESLDDFVLNEDMGTMKKFNFPRGIIKKMLGQGGWEGAGRGSDIEIVEVPKDAKKFSKVLKDDFHGGVISVDGEAKYFFIRKSERKFDLYDLDKIHKHEKKEYEDKKERERERKEREAQRAVQNENLNERRYYGYNYDPGNIGDYSGQGLAEFIQNLEGDVKVELIRSDKERKETQNKRRENRNFEDPLAYDRTSYGYGSIPKAQKDRYKKYATKKRLQIDKDVEDVKKATKEKITNNIDRALDEIIKDLRKGYGWAADTKKLGEEIMKGINLDEFKKLRAAYDAVEPGSGTKGGRDAAKA